MKLLKTAALTAVSLFWAGQAAAFWLNAGAKETTGNRNYNGVNVSGQVGLGDFSVKPMFATFHSDLSSGTFNSYSLRVGHDTKLLGLGVTGGVTPSVNGYSNQFVGADLALSITPTGQGARARIGGREQASGPAQGAGLARIDLGASAMFTNHRDHFGPAGQALGSVARLGQTDLTGSAGVSILKNLLSVDVTKSFYDHKPEGLNMRAPRVQNIIGLSQVVQGFPNTSANVKLVMSVLPLIKPFVNYTRTTFEAGESNSNAYSAGVSVELEILELSAAYERYVQAGQTDRNYFSLGASLRL
ncbi:MAG TPA: hypothetical protein DEB40_08570 [Elusimicrobia bacterium]|nr:hypothetical protein [Elusimicrobiota bacterium]